MGKMGGGEFPECDCVHRTLDVGWSPWGECAHVCCGERAQSHLGENNRRVEKDWRRVTASCAKKGTDWCSLAVRIVAVHVSLQKALGYIFSQAVFYLSHIIYLLKRNLRITL